MGLGVSKTQPIPCPLRKLFFYLNYVDLFQLMDLIKHNNPKFVCFCILALSISFVFVQGISNSHFNFSVEASQGDSQNGIETSNPDTSKDSENSGQGTGDLPGGSNLGETDGSGSSGTGGSSGDTNQTSQTQSQMTNQNGSQTTNQNLDQTTNQNASQTTNQNVDQTTNQNVNQTTNQNVNVQNKQKLELIISEEEGEAPISIEEQTRIESDDKIIITEHRGITGPECKAGNVLEGASNAEDLRVLAECQDAIGTVMHTKKMDDGDYKFFLDVEEQFKFLVNDKNNEKTDGFLVVEIVPPHQDGMYLPKDGDRVHVWGAWVTDKPKGWHEIHPTWKVVNE